MPPTDDLFIREDLSKPENRINVALFGMMQQDWFREWFLKQLKLSTDATVYPPTNVNGYRPDLKVVSPDCSVQAWIEVELGTDESQATRYEENFCEPVKTVWGRNSDGADISLEEIAGYLKGQSNFPPQVAVQVEYLCKLIQDGLEGHVRSRGRGRLSKNMRKHPLVVELEERLGNRLVYEFGTEPPLVGFLKADTTTSQNNRGFSLRVRSCHANDKTLALMSVSAGRPRVYFPSLSKLKKYLPDHVTEIERYASFLNEMGLDIGNYRESQRPWLPLDTVRRELDNFANCLKALADRPADS